MSLLGVVMYSTDRRRPQRVCEELEASLAVYLIHMKQLLWGCWIWLTMQWLGATKGGDVEHWIQSLPHYMSLKVSLPSLVHEHTSVIHTDYLSMVLRCAPLLLRSHPYMEKCVIPEIFSLHACILYVPKWWVCYHVRFVDKTFCTSANVDAHWYAHLIATIIYMFLSWHNLLWVNVSWNAKLIVFI